MLDFFGGGEAIKILLLFYFFFLTNKNSTQKAKNTIINVQYSGPNLTWWEQLF